LTLLLFIQSAVEDISQREEHAIPLHLKAGNASPFGERVANQLEIMGLRASRGPCDENCRRLRVMFIFLSTLHTKVRLTKQFSSTLEEQSMAASYGPAVISHALGDVLAELYCKILNRLRDLNAPSESDLCRWGYELLQNAKDSIAGDSSKDGVDVRIEATDNAVVFSHNGRPFSGKSLIGLLYAYSAGKRAGESTGRFGTGFLTTHALSKTVSLSSDLYIDESCTTTEAFSVTMFREGNSTSALAAGLKTMNESFVFESGVVKGWTTFTYHLRTEGHRAAMQKGVVSLLANIVPTMLFCPQIKTLELSRNGQLVRFIRGATQQVSEKLHATEFEVQGRRTVRRKFLHLSSEKAEKRLAEKYGTANRSLQITIAIEIDGEGSIVEQKSETPSHFCVFPLIGSQAHRMPVLINCSAFEPTAERRGLILTGPDMDPVSQLITDAGINRMILSETIPLFKRLVRFCSRNARNLYRLLRGLQCSPSLEEFDHRWFLSSVIEPYRSVLARYPIVETVHGNRKLFDESGKPTVFFIREEAPIEVEDEFLDVEPREMLDPISDVYDLYCAYLGSDKLPLKSHNAQWVSRAWEGCGVRTFKDLCQTIENRQTVGKLRSSAIWGFRPFPWLNAVFMHCRRFGLIDQIRSFKIIPNQNELFINLNTPGIIVTFRDTAQRITSFILDVLKEMGTQPDLRSSLVHESITTLDRFLPLKQGRKEISILIDSSAQLKISEWKSRVEPSFGDLVNDIWPILKIIPDGPQYSDRFRTKQANFFLFASSLGNRRGPSVCNNDLTIEAWANTHESLPRMLTAELAKCQTIRNLPDGIGDHFKWLDRFYEFIQKQVSDIVFRREAIVPDQTGTFRRWTELSTDAIPDVFKSTEFEQVGLKLREKLLNRNITKIAITNTKTMQDVAAFVDEQFRECTSISELSPSHWTFALLLLHILPQKTSSNFYRHANLLKVTQMLFPGDVSSMCVTHLGEKEGDLPSAWERPLSLCLNKVIEMLEVIGTIEDLPRNISQSFEFLDIVFWLLSAFRMGERAEIYPNQRGIFCRLENFQSDSEIPAELADALLVLSFNQEDIRSSFIDPRCKKALGSHKLDSALEYTCRKLDDCIRVIYEKRDGRSEPKFH
jgi:hypothetical protein